MAGGAKGIPEGASAVIPRLFCRDPEKEIGFRTRTFNAVEANRRPGADGKTARALITIGPAMVMIEREWPQIANRAPAKPVPGRPYRMDHGSVQSRLHRGDACRRTYGRRTEGQPRGDSCQVKPSGT